MEERDDIGALPDFEYVSSVRSPRFISYRAGMRVYFESLSGEKDPPCGKRDVIKDQSPASRRRCAFALGNAECEWAFTSLLTWRRIPTAEAVHRALSRLRRKWRERWQEPPCAWVMEMQTRGVPHFHLFHARESNFGMACSSAESETVKRAGKTGESRNSAVCVRGGVDAWLAWTWRNCIDDLGERTRTFNERGIIEHMRSPDAAGRYVAKESSKREQKELPERYAEGLGRWWWLNPRWAPRPRAVGMLNLREWPYENPVARVWQGEDVARAIDFAESVPWVADPKLWRELNGFSD